MLSKVTSERSARGGTLSIKIKPTNILKFSTKIRIAYRVPAGAHGDSGTENLGKVIKMYIFIYFKKFKYIQRTHNYSVKPVINSVCKHHRDKIKLLDPVVKDLISKNLEQII